MGEAEKIIVKCPACEARLRITKKNTRMKVPCPKCHTLFYVDPQEKTLDTKEKLTGKKESARSNPRNVSPAATAPGAAAPSTKPAAAPVSAAKSSVKQEQVSALNSVSGASSVPNVKKEKPKNRYVQIYRFSHYFVNIQNMLEDNAALEVVLDGKDPVPLSVSQDVKVYMDSDEHHIEIKAGLLKATKKSWTIPAGTESYSGSVFYDKSKGAQGGLVPVGNRELPDLYRKIGERLADNVILSLIDQRRNEWQGVKVSVVEEGVRFSWLDDRSNVHWMFKVLEAGMGVETTHYEEWAKLGVQLPNGWKGYDLLEEVNSNCAPSQGCVIKPVEIRFIQGLANQIIASLGMMSVTAFDKRRQQGSRVAMR